MKSIVVEEFGGVEQLKMKEVDIPVVTEGKILIEVYATSVNPVDIKRRKGAFGGKLPMILGADIAGVVKKVGAGVKGFKVGDRVMSNGGKTYSEYAVAKEESTVKLSEKTHFDEAAAIPLAGQTAWQALIDLGKVKNGDRILIHAGAGGVGTLAIQIAKDKGAWIAATGSSGNQEFLVSLGVNRPINYENENFEEVLENIDFVLDPLGGEIQEKSLHVLRENGVLVSIAEEPDVKKAAKLGVTAKWFSVRPTKMALEALNEMLNKRILKPIVSQVFPFTEENVRKAHELSEMGHVRGKLIIRMKE